MKIRNPGNGKVLEFMYFSGLVEYELIYDDKSQDECSKKYCEILNNTFRPCIHLCKLVVLISFSVLVEECDLPVCIAHCIT